MARLRVIKDVMKEFADLSAAAEISSVHRHGYTGPSQASRQKVKGPERTCTARILDLSLAKTRARRNALLSTTDSINFG